MNKPITNGRITRWLLLLQEFDITIISNPRRENVFVDLLSRIKNDGDVLSIQYYFSEEKLFSLSTKNIWFENISNYFVARKLM
jgi:hypothetical protein